MEGLHGCIMKKEKIESMNSFEISASSRIGNIRSNNEDMILVGGQCVRSDIYRTVLSTEGTDRFVIALADGMGGHNAGEVASAETLENLRFFLGDLPAGLSTSSFTEMMVEWLDSINQIISSRGYINPMLEDMGTTLVCLIYYCGRYFWANCGDSRLYRLRNGDLTQLTTDYSLNTLTGKKKHTSMITNCIGAGCKTSFLDIYEITPEIVAGDCYLLCSDGLSDMVPDEIIEQQLLDGCDADCLCETAIAAGGFDNVSACVINVK